MSINGEEKNKHYILYSRWVGYILSLGLSLSFKWGGFEVALWFEITCHQQSARSGNKLAQVYSKIKHNVWQLENYFCVLVHFTVVLRWICIDIVCVWCSFASVTWYILFESFSIIQHFSVYFFYSGIHVLFSLYSFSQTAKTYTHFVTTLLGGVVFT